MVAVFWAVDERHSINKIFDARNFFKFIIYKCKRKAKLHLVTVNTISSPFNLEKQLNR
jgi:hypothetical protein